MVILLLFIISLSSNNNKSLPVIFDPFTESTSRHSEVPAIVILLLRQFRMAYVKPDTNSINNIIPNTTPYIFIFLFIYKLIF